MKDSTANDLTSHPLLAMFLLSMQVGSCILFAWLSLRLPFDNRIDRFAVKGQAAEAAYRQFQEAFGAPEHFLVVLESREPFKDLIWSPGESFFAKIAAQPGVLAYQSLGKILPADIAVDPADLPFPFSQPQQGRYAAIFEWIDHPERMQQLHDFQTKAEQLAKDSDNPINQVIIAGEPIVNYQLNLSSQEVKTRFFPLLIAFSLLLLGILFRSIRVLFVTALAVCTALTWTMGLMVLFGESLNLVTTLIPALIFVLAVAMQVHILIGIGHCQSIRGGVRSKITPNFLVALTTSLGFGSLMLSQVQPIAVMGKYMAMGIWLIFIWSHLTHFGLSRLCKLKVENPTLPFFNQAANSSAYRTWSRQSRWPLLAVAIILLGFWWLPHNPTESNGLKYFNSQHPIRQVTDYVQVNLTGASQLEILLPRPKNDDQWIEHSDVLLELEQKIGALPKVRHLLSPVRLAQFTTQILPFASSSVDAAWLLLNYQQAALMARYQNEKFYRIQLLVDSMDREAYDQLRNQLTLQLQASALTQDGLVTGPLARIIEIQRYLLQSLAISLGTTVAVVLILMMVFLRVWRHPSLILLPNLLPLACMALAMGALGLPTTISSVMVFSIAFGIAVDDTIHLLYSFKHCSKEGFWERWRATFLQDARAISLTTLTLSVGFLVLATSQFLPTRDFGLLMGIGMICALLSDLSLLPPLLWRLEAKSTRSE